MLNKKYIAVFFVMLWAILGWFGYFKIESENAALALSDSVIRFHILANSDSNADQQLKMKVKENVINYIYEKTANFNSLSQAKTFIIENDRQIIKIAQNTVAGEGYSYHVISAFGEDDFPGKSYGDLLFPSGRYTSYTITIGKGKGHNWWCVLYPPLCFTDVSTGTVPESSKKQLQESLSEKEYQTVIRYRFKYFTFLNKYLYD